MIDIPKVILSKAKNGEMEILESHLMNNYTYPAIIKAFAELIVTAESEINKPQVLVTQEEYDAITSMFRVRGQRIVGGEVVRERRGRPRLQRGDETPEDSLKLGL